MTDSVERRPLVSVVMPTYKVVYLERALNSLRMQEYPTLELVVCDDCPDDAVEKVVTRFAEKVDFPVIYSRNPTRLYEMRSTARAIALASGTYIKFLHDDDELAPDCVGRLLEVLEEYPAISLASSRRQLINEAGNALPDTMMSARLFDGDVVIDGRQLTAFFGEYTLNVIGEPSAVMCRRADLVEYGDELTVLNGQRIGWVADLAIYVKLLQRGDLAMLDAPLSRFRVSTQQFSQIGRDNPGIGDNAHGAFRSALRELGWSREGGAPSILDVAPLDRPQERVSIDLLALLQQAGERTRPAQYVSDWLRKRNITGQQLWFMEKRFGARPRPTIAVFVIDRQGDTAGLQRTLASLWHSNKYRQIQVWILSSGQPVAAPEQESQIFVPLPAGAPLAGVLNESLERCGADWFVLAQAGDEFTASGLILIALELLNAPDCRALYADSVMQDTSGGLGVALRPDFNLDLLLSYPAGMSGNWLYRRSLVAESGGFDGRFEQALEFELQLRLIELGGLAGLGHVSELLLITSATVLRDNLHERLAIERHLATRGYEQARVGSQWPGRYQIDYGHSLRPGVSIVICADGQLSHVQRCVESLLGQTRYDNYEILLLDNGTGEVGLREWLSAIEAMGEQQLQVLRPPHGTNPQASRNWAAAQARGDFLLFFGATCAALADDWLEQLLNHGLRPEVGIVGAKLLSAQGEIEHAGFILGLQGPVGEPFKGDALDAVGYMNRLQVEQNLSAVSGDCLLILKELFNELGGFDEGELGKRWSAVDLCLRAGQQGYLTVWTPRAQLMLDDVATPAASVAEQDLLRDKWLPHLANDPAYNPLFSPHKPFALGDFQFCWKPLGSWRPQKIVVGHPADRFGCGHYRLIQPFQALKRSGWLDGMVADNYLPMEDLQRLSPDVVVFQRQYSAEQIEWMARTKRFSKAFKVYELDDYLPGIPLGNPHRDQVPRDIQRSLRKALTLVDRFVVSTPALAEACAGWHQDIVVVENYLPGAWWLSQKGQRRTGPRPRVGWAGGGGHGPDLALIVDVVRELADEVDWVFMGMLPNALRPYVREHHPGVEIERYPAALAALNLDLAVAPLAGGLFNECKSNLRLLEYGACGFPVVCSDIGNFRGELPVTRVRNRFKDWVDAIRSHLADPDASEAMGDALRSAVHEGWILRGDGLQRWRKAWFGE